MRASILYGNWPESAWGSETVREGNNFRYVKSWASQVALVVKNLPANAGDIRDTALIPRLGRSPEGGHGNPLQYSFLENPMDRGTWRAVFFLRKELGKDQKTAYFSE